MDAVIGALTAAGSGLVAGSILLLGAAVAWLVRVPQAIVAGITAFGAGVLIAALAYELVAEAHADGGLWPTVLGFVLGAIIYVAAAEVVDARGRRGSGNRKRGGLALLIGALVDGIPESVVLGTTVAATGGLSLPILLAIAIANLPEGLASAAGMKDAGRPARYVFGVWGAVVVVSGVASLLGYLLLRDAPAELIAFITTIAAGGMLAMVCNTMIPTAFARDRAATGLLATLGFLAAFILSHLG
ncbi:ZIP family metal transporter [Pseudolysinimonas yzui]|uniref:ZIP family zinc transporter n=1 Tax=Pseudolysinimonas yzui TaxID=2708254 RepID=A0A8J3GPV4_9MICO|nr:ZIP family zinc transporter [Pseudolysinimonas yzui]GHF11658.1 ZIP family zinc transporter [Pseudolysinimonas yzui]